MLTQVPLDLAGACVSFEEALFLEAPRLRTCSGNAVGAGAKGRHEGRACVRHAPDRAGNMPGPILGPRLIFSNPASVLASGRLRNTRTSSTSEKPERLDHRAAHRGLYLRRIGPGAHHAPSTEDGSPRPRAVPEFDFEIVHVAKRSGLGAEGPGNYASSPGSRGSQGRDAFACREWGDR